MDNGEPRRRWRFYESPAGRRPVRDFLESLSDIDAATILEEMRSVARHGLREARHLHGDIYKVRAEAQVLIYDNTHAKIPDHAETPSRRP